MRAALVVAVCGCSMGGPPPSRDEPPPADVTLVRGSIAVDGDSACAIEASGKVACWGRSSATPVEIPKLDDVVGLAAGPSTTCAWTARGAVACWGDDARNSLAPNFDDIVQISAGIDSTCGLHASGRVSCWSNGSKDAHDVPGLADAVEIAGAYSVGAEELCARSKSGDVTCGNQVKPLAAIPELAGATSLGGAGCRFAALMPGHRVASWVGYTGRPMPAFLANVDGERVIVGGHLNGKAELCVLGAHARCWAWSDEPSTLVEAPPLRAGVRDLAVDTEATCMRIGDRVECSGRLGRLGDGETEYPHDFVPVEGIADARQLEAVGRTTCALRATGRVACWGERLLDDDATRGPALDREPVELPGVTDAVEIAMEGADRGNGGIGVAVSVCARRAHGVMCWTVKHGDFQASDAPELAAAVKLYSGPTICGVSASGAVGCVPLHHAEGYIPTFSEDDYEKFVYAGSADAALGRITRELEKRLRRALASNKQLEGFHRSGTTDLIDRIGPTFPPPLDQAGAPRKEMLGMILDVIEQRRIEWAVDWDSERVRGARCVRRSNGTVLCWGERDYLGAGQHSTRDPVTVTNVVMGPQRHVMPAPK
jgi:hypothetical protein